MADEKQIRQACSNLIKNSYENITLNKIRGKIQLFWIENDFASITIMIMVLVLISQYIKNT